MVKAQDDMFVAATLSIHPITQDIISTHLAPNASECGAPNARRSIGIYGGEKEVLLSGVKMFPHIGNPDWKGICTVL